MSKVHFFYGTVNAAKSAELIMKAYYLINEVGKNVKVYKPECDSRDGAKVKSRIGIEIDAENVSVFLDKKTIGLEDTEVVFIDEVQFLSKEEIASVIQKCAKLNIQLFCYGLRTDFKGKLFPGIEVLMAHATSIDEIKSYCACCGKKKAIYNAKLDNGGYIITEGDSISPGFNYKGYCYDCFTSQLIV